MKLFDSDTLIIDEVGAAVGGEAYLVRTPERSLVFDTGFAFSAPGMVERVAELLRERPLDYIFLSHSHYDHVSGTPWLKQRWPDAKVLAGEYAARIFGRPGALATIKELNLEAELAARTADVALEARTAGTEPTSRTTEAELATEAQVQPATSDFSALEHLAVDQTVADGSVINLGSIQLEVIAAPGHTRCSLMLWCASERLLFGSESLGVWVNSELVMPAYLVSYADSINTIKTAQGLSPEFILLNHRHVIGHQETRQFLQNAERDARKTAQIVWQGAAEGKTAAELETQLKKLFYVGEARELQPEAAFDLNNRCIVKHLLSCHQGGAD